MPPSTPQILVQQRVNTYQISLRGSEDDSFGAPKLDDHYSNQEYNSNNIVNSNGWQGSYKNKTPSKDISPVYIYARNPSTTIFFSWQLFKHVHTLKQSRYC